ncbi:hypothetical protein [Propionispira arboris]|nr:hypothetical protein [Propionispira arboris]
METYGELKKDIGWILRKLCEDKSGEIIEEKAWQMSEIRWNKQNLL